VPFLLDVLELLANVAVPKGADKEHREAQVGEDDREEPAHGGEAVEGLIVAALAVLARARCRPPVNVLQDVARLVHHDEDRRDDTDVGRAPLFAVTAAAPAGCIVDVHADTEKHDEIDEPADDVPD